MPPPDPALFDGVMAGMEIQLERELSRRMTAMTSILMQGGGGGAEDADASLGDVGAALASEALEGMDPQQQAMMRALIGGLQGGEGDDPAGCPTS